MPTTRAVTHSAFVSVAVAAVTIGCVEIERGPCVRDRDCSGGESCRASDGTSCASGGADCRCVVPGEGEGEGEGECNPPPGEDECDVLIAFGPSDCRATLDSCVLRDDPGNAGQCAAGSSAYAIECGLLEYVPTGDCAQATGCSGDEVLVAVDGAVPIACASLPTLNGGALVCPLCFDTFLPGLLTVHLDDDGNGSASSCVDTSGATPP